MRKNYYALLMLIPVVVFLCYSCIIDQDKTPIPSKEIAVFPPLLNIINATDITDSSAVLEIEIVKDWGFPILTYGACWYLADKDLGTEPVINHKLIKQTTHNCQPLKFCKTGMRKLFRDTTYLVRAYAINSAGVGYSPLFSFKTTKKESKLLHSVIDVEGNVYTTVTVGSQTWTKENLRTTHFRNGTPLYNQTENWPLITYPSFRWPQDDSTKSFTGVFYNWYAAVDVDQFVPYGWRIPTEPDFKQLMLTPNYQNLLDFSFSETSFANGLANGWWCATDNNPNPYSLYFSGDTLTWGNGIYKRTTGLYLRCIKN